MGRKAMPKRNGSKNDMVMTPAPLALDLMRHFRPGGRFLDPCRGDGAFTNAACVMGADKFFSITVCEIMQGLDFFDLNPAHPFDWIVSNPPYSILTPWLKHSFEIADNVVYLILPPAALFVARKRAARDAGFAIREIYYLPVPAEWAKVGLSFGMGLGAVWWQRGWTGGITETYAPGALDLKQRKKGKLTT